MLAEKKKQIRNEVKLVSALLKFTLLVAIIVVIPLYLWFFHQDVIQEFSSIDKVKAFFAHYHTESIFIYLGLQIVQIIISIIPGQELQMVAGLVYGLWPGFLLSMIGAFVGSTITYYLAGFLGRDALHILFGKRHIDEYLAKINSKKGFVLVFLIYLIPGVPKDLCNYAAGLSHMKIKAFLVLSMIGRIPGILGSLIIGAEIGEGNYISVVVISVVAIILFLLGVKFHSKISHLLDTVYDKLSIEKNKAN